MFYPYFMSRRKSVPLAWFPELSPLARRVSNTLMEDSPVCSHIQWLPECRNCAIKAFRSLLDFVVKEEAAAARRERQMYDFLFSSNLQKRFWSHVTKGEECWEWNGSRNRSGYGMIATRGGGLDMERAHRVSWRLHNGIIPPYIVVRHKCDNRACVRPDHLELGTQQDNIRDMDTRGRRRNWRMLNPMPKLTEEQVIEIRAADGTFMELGRRFGVTATTIRDIKKGKTWTHLK